MSGLNPAPGFQHPRITNPQPIRGGSQLDQARTSLGAHLQARGLGQATVEAGRTPLAPNVQGLAAPNTNPVQIRATAGGPQLNWDTFKAQVTARGVSEGRAKVLYDHYRLGNDVAGSRMLHRRGQIPQERYRNTATMMHSIKMTWEGQGTRTPDLGLLYAHDKGAYAKHHLEANGRIYNPTGVEATFKKWEKGRTGDDAPGADNKTNKAPKEEKKAAKKPRKKYGGGMDLGGVLAQLKTTKIDNSSAVAKMKLKDAANNEKAVPTKAEMNEVQPGHDMQSNLAWLLGAMHQGETFELVGPLTPNSILRGSSLRNNAANPEASALMREVRALLANGYEVDTAATHRSTQETPVLILRPSATFNPAQVSLADLENSAPNTPATQQEITNWTRSGLYDARADFQVGPRTLDDVNQRMDVLVQERDRLVQADKDLVANGQPPVFQPPLPQGRLTNPQPVLAHPTPPAQPVQPTNPQPVTAQPSQGPGTGQTQHVQAIHPQPVPAQPTPPAQQVQPVQPQPVPAQPIPHGQPAAGTANNPYDVNVQHPTQNTPVNGLDRTTINS